MPGSAGQLRELAIRNLKDAGVDEEEKRTRIIWENRWILSYLGEGQYFDDNGVEYAVFPGDKDWEEE